MPKLTWTVVNSTQANLDLTQYVQSLNFTLGRPTALSPYSGNSATITMFSYGGRESSINVNDKIIIQAAASGGGSNNNLFVGFVAARNYSDEPGTGVNSTMTVLINDAMLQAGMANFQNQTLTSTNTQIDEIDTLLTQIEIQDFGSDVSISTGSFTVNANQRINEIIAGDRGVLFNDSSSAIAYYKPSRFKLLVSTAVSIGRTTSATQIAYQDLVRVEAASNSLFYTQATVTGSASTETKSSAALTTYGTRTFTASTAQSNLVESTAEWYANAFTNPETVMLNLSFSDVAQNTDALKLINALFFFNKFLQVSYTPPGESAVTGYFWPEQITFNATTSQTTINMLMTPLTYYANFILNDAVFGVLDTDRLGV